jgi:hypothetical protein
MIVRIKSESQYGIDEKYATVTEEINRLDARLATAVETNDAKGFQDTLAQLVEKVHRYGPSLPASELVVSDVIVPPADITLGETRDLLARNSVAELEASLSS